MGASWIDGLIADRWLIPPELEHGYSERVLRLPWAFVSSPPPEGTAPPPPPGRAELGLPQQGVVFACFNRAEKLDPQRVDQWLEILRRVPGAVLWLLLEHPLVRRRLRERAAAAGIDPQRLVFGELMEGARFAAACSLADLFLDTATYGAGATAVTALRAWGPASWLPWVWRRCSPPHPRPTWSRRWPWAATQRPWRYYAASSRSTSRSCRCFRRCSGYAITSS